jgi:hypothetical protein
MSQSSVCNDASAAMLAGVWIGLQLWLSVKSGTRISIEVHRAARVCS